MQGGDLQDGLPIADALNDTLNASCIYRHGKKKTVYTLFFCVCSEANHGKCVTHMSPPSLQARMIHVALRVDQALDKYHIHAILNSVHTIVY
jgi:hypothetical protein